VVPAAAAAAAAAAPGLPLLGIGVLGVTVFAPGLALTHRPITDAAVAVPTVSSWVGGRGSRERIHDAILPRMGKLEKRIRAGRAQNLDIAVSALAFSLLCGRRLPDSYLVVRKLFDLVLVRIIVAVAVSFLIFLRVGTIRCVISITCRQASLAAGTGSSRNIR